VFAEKKHARPICALYGAVEAIPASVIFTYGPSQLQDYQMELMAHAMMKRRYELYEKGHRFVAERACRELQAAADGGNGVV